MFWLLGCVVMKTISSRETVVGRGRGRGGKSRLIFFLRKYKVVSTPQIFCLVYFFTVMSFFLLLQFRNTEIFAVSGLCFVISETGHSTVIPPFVLRVTTYPCFTNI